MAVSGGKLYLVPTPIGNMGDISQRVVDVLNTVNLVACEDTRRTGTLLKKLELKKKLISYHEFNERERAAQLLKEINQGQSVAVVTDAGSPGISDPAYRIVRTAIDHGLEVIPLPGPCAIIPALTASGLPTDRFFFEGFLSHKSGQRRKRIEELKEFEHTLVFYESPYRAKKTLADMLELLGDRPACLAREISKMYEEFVRGHISEILTALGQKNLKGEIVLVVEGAKVPKRLSEEKT